MGSVSQQLALRDPLSQTQRLSLRGVVTKESLLRDQRRQKRKAPSGFSVFQTTVRPKCQLPRSLLSAGVSAKIRTVPTSSPAPINIFELAQGASEYREYRVGGYVCLDRKGTPWRVTRLAALDEQQATTENGYVYDRRTGRRLVPDVPSHDELRPLTRDRIDSLVVREFLDLASRLKHSKCSDKQIEQLVPLAYSFLSVIKAFDRAQPKQS